MYKFIKICEEIINDIVDLKNYDFVLDLSKIKEELGGNSIHLNRETVNALLKAQKELPDNDYRFIISSGYRSYEDQQKLNDLMKKELQKSHPDEWEKLLNDYTGGDDYLKYLRDTDLNKLSRMSHSSGYAVDIIGIKNISTGEELNLGGESKLDNSDRLDYYSKDTEIGKNRKILGDILKNNGFKNIENEYWHWGYYGS